MQTVITARNINTNLILLLKFSDSADQCEILYFENFDLTSVVTPVRAEILDELLKGCALQ